MNWFSFLFAIHILFPFALAPLLFSFQLGVVLIFEIVWHLSGKVLPIGNGCQFSAKASQWGRQMAERAQVKGQRSHNRWNDSQTKHPESFEN